jgi:fatty acid desaturase
VAQPVLALGAALLTVSGSVWYVPALADLRAGDDRPRSRRDAAAACVSAWGATGVTAVLLLVAGPWWVPALTAAAGAAVSCGFRTRAAVRRRREAEETARHWARLGSRPQAAEDRSRTGRNAFAALLAAGLLTAAATAALLLTGGPTAPYWLTAAVPATLVALFLLLAATAAHPPGGRHPANRHPGRP